MTDLIESVTSPLTRLLESMVTNRHQTKAGKRLAYHASLREGLKEVPGALSKLDALLVDETDAFCKKEEYLLLRRFDGRPLFWGIIFCILTLLSAALGFAWTVQSWAAGWGGWVLVGMSLLTGLLAGTAVTLFRFIYWVPQAAAQPQSSP